MLKHVCLVVVISLFFVVITRNSCVRDLSIPCKMTSPKDRAPILNTVRLLIHPILTESATTTGFVMAFGEITTNAIVDYQRVIRETIRDIGYDCSSKGT